MGAQNEKRKEKFIQRYNEVENNDGKALLYAAVLYSTILKPELGKLLTNHSLLLIMNYMTKL